MSKELKPLEAWKLIDKSGTIETLCIIETALKRNEKLERYIAKLLKEDNKKCKKISKLSDKLEKLEKLFKILIKEFDLKASLNTIYNCNKTNKEDKKIIEQMLKEMFK